LNKIQIWENTASGGGGPGRKPQEDRHFTLLVSTGHEASALRQAVSSLEPEVLRQVEMSGLPAPFAGILPV
jgi:hypothetical protein